MCDIQNGFEGTENVCDIPHDFEATENVCYIPNKNRQNTFLTGLPIFLGKGVAADLSHQACHGPLRDVTYHEIVLKTVTHLNILPFWKMLQYV